MTWRKKRQMFQLAVRLYSLRSTPRIVVIDKEVRKSKTTSDPVTPSDWAIDFLGCLPEDREKKIAIISLYDDKEHDKLSPRQCQAFGRMAGEFWRQVNQKGLARDGEFLLDVMKAA